MGSVPDIRTGAGETQGRGNMSTSLQADETLVEDATSSSRDQIDIEDWSQTGRGSHVDFGDEETIPIVQGRFLGRGAMGDVYETSIQGYKVAHKRTLFKRRIGRVERKEVEILQRLSHVHIVQLIGTYTQGRHLGILMYPVAVCDLHTFFEDVETWSKAITESNTPEKLRKALGTDVTTRLHALNYDFPQGEKGNWASVVYCKMGCLVSAITYLHEQRIRHKDLKPSNILLSPGRLWLSDFGSATDFTLLSQSATDNERGTPRYFAPEVAEWKPNGRAADMFSLGCVLLEILTLNRRGSLHVLRAHRGANPAYHANVSHLSTWLETDDTQFSRREHYLEYEINLMLSADPKRRPKAVELLHGITSHDAYPSIFGDCCKRTLVPQSELRIMVDAAAKTKQLTEELRTERREARKTRTRHERYVNATKRKVADHVEDLKRKHDEVLKQKDKDLQTAETAIENLQYELSGRDGELTEIKAACENLEDKVHQLQAQISEGGNQDNLEDRTLNVEDAMSSETVLKQDRDRSSHFLNSAQEHDKHIAQISITANIRKFDTRKDQRVDQSSKTPNNQVPRRPSREKIVRRVSAFELLAPGVPRKTELRRSKSGQADALVALQSEQSIKSEGSGAKGRKSNIGFLEAMANGLKPGVPAARQAPRVAYEKRRTTEEGTTLSGRRSR